MTGRNLGFKVFKAGRASDYKIFKAGRAFFLGFRETVLKAGRALSFKVFKAGRALGFKIFKAGRALETAATSKAAVVAAGRSDGVIIGSGAQVRSESVRRRRIERFVQSNKRFDIKKDIVEILVIVPNRSMLSSEVVIVVKSQIASKQGMEAQSANLPSQLRGMFDTGDGRQTKNPNQAFACIVSLLPSNADVCPDVNGQTRYVCNVTNQSWPRLTLWNHVGP